MSDDAFLNKDDLDSFLNKGQVNNDLVIIENDMRSLLDCFSTSNTLNNSEIANVFISYFEKYKRFLYSTITPYLISINNSQDRENFLQNILHFYQSEEAHSLPEEIKDKVLKLYDHVNLVIQQNTAFNTPKQRIRKISQDAMEDVKKEINEEVHSINTQLISIVSIFVAISFVMFGGMSLLNNLFDYSELNHIPMIEMLCGGSLIGIIIIFAIYIFIIFILKLSKNVIDLEEKSFYKHILFKIQTLLLVILIITFALWMYKSYVTSCFENKLKAIQSECRTVDYDSEAKEYTLICPYELEEK